MDTTAVEPVGAIKEILLVLPGNGGEGQHVKVHPNSLVHDVLASAGLTGYQIALPTGGFFNWNDDLYAAVYPGQKLFLNNASVEAGASA